MTRAVVAALLLAVSLACGDRDRPVGVIEGGRRTPVEDLEAREPGADRRILFGDLHVHSTYSIDAFIYSLPLFGGEGAHPPADACDYARYCSALDFVSVTDHAEGLTPDLWERIKGSTRHCNALAGDPADPDLVSFIGWEWTQAGPTPEQHYGHKNVIFPGLGEDEVPARPIGSLPHGTSGRAPPALVLKAVRGLLAAAGQDEYADFLWAIERLAEVPECPDGVNARELPRACMENAPTPAALFEKLDQWGFEALVIPHGLGWGIHAPPGAKLDLQLDPRNHDPERQRLLEIFSGHGNSEEHRTWRAFEADAEGEMRCPRPSAERLPCCWRAGEIVRERCGDLPAAECEARVREARRLALEAGRNPRRVLPDTDPEDWLDCDQCRDCFKPAYNLRPRQSAQYALAIGSFGSLGSDPLRYRFGFVASSDDHKAQPGTGYKQRLRRKNTDAKGIASPATARWVQPWALGRQEDPQRAQAAPPPRERGFRELFDVERVASFLYPGGLVAVHADGRSRDSIWKALTRREVYGTSGPRILLWFDLVNAPAGRLPMGSAAGMAETPRFEVRAVGSFVQKPGCPESSRRGLSPERLQRLCRGECLHPSDRRHPIRSIEVVRIRPQRQAGEPVALLIDDPWRRFECPADPAGCRVVFDDPQYAGSGRDTVYYVRALQEETPAINGANLRAERDASGRVMRTSPCYGSYKTPADDDCLAPVRERAWSSPIFVDQPRHSVGG
jgi:hypothetical protein